MLRRREEHGVESGCQRSIDVCLPIIHEEQLPGCSSGGLAGGTIDRRLRLHRTDAITEDARVEEFADDGIASATDVFPVRSARIGQDPQAVAGRPQVGDHGHDRHVQPEDRTARVQQRVDVRLGLRVAQNSA